ncbi:metal-dependent hydrolase [Halomicroarcula sp. F13]|uniref:Metal-dependent hydrolase n=1 Tax=Haloarcula rubra TaxID=2487747 RepID=A0AAW4PRU9_9EURY|nr:metal-dependent hydrolase [Halomicroarcula rubra]MBX0323052.1 metal-dependent hydrolase [Halomicroarcula rubra]
MYRPGHYGAALLAYAPLGLGLILLDAPGLAVAGGALSLVLAPVPDYDQRVPFVSHRGVTHTLLFAVVVGLLLGGAGWLVGSASGVATATRLAAFGLVVGLTGIVSHLLADVVTPAGIAPFWPLSGKNYTLGLTRADNTVANYLVLALGVFAVAFVVAVARPSVLTA